jgi:hypothetical protein
MKGRAKVKRPAGTNAENLFLDFYTCASFQMFWESLPEENPPVGLIFASIARRKTAVSSRLFREPTTDNRRLTTDHCEKKQTAAIYLFAMASKRWPVSVGCF